MTPFPQFHEATKMIQDNRMRERDEIRLARLARGSAAVGSEPRPRWSRSRLTLSFGTLLHGVRL